METADTLAVFVSAYSGSLGTVPPDLSCDKGGIKRFNTGTCKKCTESRKHAAATGDPAYPAVSACKEKSLAAV